MKIRRKRQSGFSMIELIVAIGILTTVIGVVMAGISQIEQRSASDVNKVGVAQESRQFMDQILRDLRQAGYPSLGMFDPTTLVANPSAPPLVVCTNNSNVACGLINFSSTAIQYEGDIDGSGVSEVYVQAILGSGGSCPCIVQRGTVSKTSYLLGGTPAYYTELDNVMSQNVFTAYKYDGSAYNSSTDGLSSIKNIGITLYVQSPTPDVNQKSVVYPTTTMVSEARINN